MPLGVLLELDDVEGPRLVGGVVLSLPAKKEISTSLLALSTDP